MGKRPPAQSVLHVSPELSRQTLGAALRQWQAGKSWSQVRQLINQRRVLLDGNLALDHSLRLKAGQVIKLLDYSQAAPATEHDVRILYFDADVVVVDKPSGMTTMRHPEEKAWSARRRQLQPTLTELLPRLLAKLDRGPGAQRAVRPVHRLDRETSGVMVFARNIKAESALGRQFRAHTTQRTYWAIVQGRVEAQTIDTRLVRDRGDGRRGSADEDVEVGKRAITHVKPVQFLPPFTLVECQLETGRTHQIRIHLAEIGHPVCGDKVYGRRTTRQSSKNTPPRLALHAARLGFIHPKSGETMSFESGFPFALREFIDRCQSP